MAAGFPPLGWIIRDQQERLRARERAADMLPFPMCAVCGHPVEMMEITDDVQNMRSKVSVQCHGATETMWLSRSDIIEIGKQGFMAGTAFQPAVGLLEG